MLLSASVFSVFSEYVGILLFICLPVILLAAGLSIFLHFRQKRKKAALNNSELERSDISLESTVIDSHSVVTSPLAQEDKMGLLKECRKQFIRSRAKFMALKHDFILAQKNFSTTKGVKIETVNNSIMENMDDKMAAYEKQIAGLQNKLEVLETVIPVQDETYYLRQILKEKENDIEQYKIRIAELELGMLQTNKA